MISPEDRRWVILNTSETGSIDFTQVCESSPKTLKVTNDGSQTFVKWDKLVAVEQVLYTDDDFDIPEGRSIQSLFVSISETSSRSSITSFPLDSLNSSSYPSTSFKSSFSLSLDFDEIDTF